ncbi:hypothetical protein D9757_011186 [Collybiopsis confluens]|uniref:DUF7918 domain-containing protein n=1 Tax=Collybiopsis confluens TaxID=2823264 RepID=A0A8H5H317_9AGAR|nr:hypothetical protein D9757_011186 [Collybiopsis confluens]
MPAHKSFSASVIVDGKPLEEYSVKTVKKKGGTTTVTCWIPSEAGKRYEVHWKDSACKQPTKGRLYIDGHPCGGKICQKKNQIKIQRGIRQAETTLTSFEFASLLVTGVLVADDDEASALEMPRNAGQIELRIRNYQIEGRGMRTESKFKALPTPQTYSEKAKKGIDHLTSLSGTITCSRATRTVRGESIGKTFLRFRFRYRPIGILCAQGIAPPLVTLQSESSSGSRKRASSFLKEEDEKPAIIETIEISDDEDSLKESTRFQDPLQARVNEQRARRPFTRSQKRIKLEAEQARIETEPSGSGQIVVDLTW